jgi:hypothetical protein
VLSVGPADVGARVVVRHALREGGLSDLLGELVRWDDEVAVRDRSGAGARRPADRRRGRQAGAATAGAPGVTPTRARFAEVVRSEPVDVGLACLLVGGEVRPDLDVDESLEQLDVMAEQTRWRMTSRRPEDAAEAIRRVLHMGYRLRGTDDDFDDVRSSLLSEVLVRKRGLPLLLSVVWTEVAARLGSRRTSSGCPAGSSSWSASRRTCTSSSTPGRTGGC